MTDLKVLALVHAFGNDLKANPSREVSLQILVSFADVAR